MGVRMHNTPLRLAFLAAAILGIATAAAPARAQGFFDDLYPGFFTLQKPGTLNLTGFAGGYGSNTYGTIQEGFQFEQSLTPYIGAVGRVTGYELFEGGGFANPLNPGNSHEARLNFARFQGGVDLNLYPGTHLYILGGKDAGDSHANNIEGDFSSWLFLHSLHPVNFSFSASHGYENGVTSSSIDLQTIVASTEKWIFLAGGGGAIYGGGFVSGVAGQGGPDLGCYYRPWNIGFSAQAGYGAADQYGQLTIYKQLTIFE
ncbi:MAG: hypothetical protein ACLQAT_23745 [Candidatus Binataceae bacterium]